MWSDLAGSILLWALILSGYLAAMWLRFRRRRNEPFVVWAKIVGYAVAAFFFGLMLTVSNPFARVHGAVPTQGPAPTRCFRTGRWWPSTHRFCTSAWSVSPCRSAWPWPAWSRAQSGTVWLPESPAVGHFCLGVPDRRRRPRRLVELPGPRVGGLLVLGPGRELRSAALADGHRVPALGHGPAEAGHAAGLEPVAPPGHFQPHHPGDVLHSLGGPGVRALVHRRWRGRPRPARLFRAGGGHFHRAPGLAGRPAAQPGLDRDPGLARGRFPGQQPAVCRFRLRRAARHRLPSVRGSGERLVNNGGRAVLRHHDAAVSPVPAVPDGRGARAAMAPGLG